MALIDRIDRLKSQLLTTGLSRKDQPLFQVIDQLITTFRDLIVQVNAIITGVSGTITGLENADFITFTDESATLPNSRNLIAGTSITFDDTVANQRTVNGSVGVSPNEDFLTFSNESAALPNSRQLLAGTGVTFDDSIANQRTVNIPLLSGAEWSVLTNGDLSFPELIFVGGDVVMLHTP